MITKARVSQKGVALLTATVIIVIVAGMSAAFLMLSFNQRKFISEASDSELTLHVAEAGVEDTINKMQAYGLKWAVNKLPPSPPLTTNFDYHLFQTDTTSLSLTFTGAMNGGTWTATIRNNKGTAPVYPNPFSYTFPDYGDPIWWIIDATGTRGNNSRSLQILTSAFDQNSGFSKALFGDVEVDALGTFKSDGYKSASGTYGAQATKSYTFPDGKTITYADATGNLGSNGNIITGGNVMIMGNATPGPGGTTSGGGNIFGSTTPATQTEALPVPDVQFPGGATYNTTGNGAQWTSGSSTIGTFTTGDPTYGNVGTAVAGAGSPLELHWAEMKPTGNGSLDIYQDTTIYVDGLIDMKNTQSLNIKCDSTGKPYTVKIMHNGVYPASNTPANLGITINGQSIAGAAAKVSAKNLQIYSSTTGTIMFNGGSTVYAAVNAPKAYFKNNGGNELYGSVIASRMLLSGNAFFHYDASLRDLAVPQPKFKIVSWRETAH